MTRAMRLISYCLFSMIAVQPFLFAEILVEGDRVLLDVLRSAQQTNLTRGERGRLKATVHTEFPVRPEKQQYEILMIWDKDRMYWEYDSLIEKYGAIHTQRGLRQLEAPSVRICYLPQEDRLVSWPAKSQAIPEGLLIRPKDCWYHFVSERNWLQIFDPSFLESDVESVRVEMQGTDKIVFQRTYKVGIRFTVISSLKAGANVLHYETTPAVKLASAPKNVPNPIYRGDYSWTEDGRSGFRLAKAVQSEADALDPGSPYWKRTITVHEFDAEYAPSAAQFTFEALDFKPGTVVDEYSPAHRSYLHGLRPVSTVQEDLDSLLQRLPKRGFTLSTRGP